LQWPTTVPSLKCHNFTAKRSTGLQDHHLVEVISVRTLRLLMWLMTSVVMSSIVSNVNDLTHIPSGALACLEF